MQSSSEDLMFRLDLLENAFIVYYETPPKPWHDLFFGKKLVLVIPQYFVFNLRLHIISGVIKIIFK